MAKMHLIPYQVEEIEDTATDIPQGVQMIQAPDVWEQSDEGSGNVIAIIDTGCDTSHPDLSGQVIDGKNFTNDGDGTQYGDDNGHGTHVAGTAAAAASEEGISGVEIGRAAGRGRRGQSVM